MPSRLLSPPVIEASIVPPDRRGDALRLFFQHLSLNERKRNVDELLTSADQGDFSLDGLLMVEVDEQVVGVTLYSPQPDDVAFLWPPVTRPQMRLSLRCEIQDALLRAIDERLQQTDVWLEQCLLELTQEEEQAMLHRNGFVHLADLSFLQRSLIDPIPALPAEPLEQTHYDVTSPECVERFCRVMELTYDGSLDCPLLHERLTGQQALKTHEHSGEFDPQLWTLFTDSSGCDAGVLLMSRHPENRSFEVCYLGVSPQFRGKGYGRDMMITALHQAKAEQQDSVFLAVDTRNHFAQQLYENLGFMELCQRTVSGRLR